MASTVPQTQKALVIPTKQADFAVATVDVPKPAQGEVLVKAEAIGLNPVDWVVQVTGFFDPVYPAILGWEASGVVVEVGEGVTSLTVGEKV